MHQSLQICNLNCQGILGKKVLVEEKSGISSEERVLIAAVHILTQEVFGR